MVDRTANTVNAVLSVLVIATILLGTAASLLGFVSLGILAVSAARPDILPAPVARRRSTWILALAVLMGLVEVLATAVLHGRGLV